MDNQGIFNYSSSNQADRMKKVLIGAGVAVLIIVIIIIVVAISKKKSKTTDSTTPPSNTFKAGDFVTYKFTTRNRDLCWLQNTPANAFEAYGRVCSVSGDYCNVEWMGIRNLTVPCTFNSTGQADGWKATYMGNCNTSPNHVDGVSGDALAAALSHKVHYNTLVKYTGTNWYA